MSHKCKDIRSYFTVKSKTGSDKKINSDDNSPKKQTKKKKVTRIIDSDSDDETSAPKKLKLTSSSDKKEPHLKKTLNGSKTETLVSVDPQSIFGSEAPKRSLPKHKISSKKPTQSIDSTFCLDEDSLDVDLKAIDEVEKNYFKEKDGAEKDKTSRKHSESKSTPKKECSSLDKTLKNDSSQNDLKKALKFDKLRKTQLKSLDADSDTLIVKCENNQKSQNVKNEEASHKITISESERDVKSKSKTPDKSLVKNAKVPTPKDKSSSVKNAKVPTPKVEEVTSPGSSDSPGFRQKNRAHYISYLHRGGPKHLGEKELPKGKPDCLSKLTFVITGVLDSLERDDAVTLIQQHGGKVMSTLSRNTSYIIVGTEAGPSKLEKAKTLKTRQLDEDGLLNLIRQRSGIPEGKNEIPGNETMDIDLPETETMPNKSSVTEVVDAAKSEPACTTKPSTEKISDTESSNKATSETSPKNVKSSSTIASAELWVDKYAPKSLNQIIGQQGDRSNARKLMRWAKEWHSNHSGNKKLTRPSPWSKDDSGAFFKAALLSGPPGVGKTTTAHLVCKELGYDIVEMNASDTRSKTLLHEGLSKLVSCKSLSTVFKEGSNGKPTEKHVLLMDEVDGMAGNEDRGGMQELIQVIKNTRVPIICMCNDRHHPKVRSLANYCFDLHFNKPRLEQIRGAMMSVCFKEGIKIPTEALNDIISASNNDIRQVLHHLFMFSIKEKTMSVDQTKQDSKNAKKIIHLGPWDVLRKVFSAEEHKNMSLYDKSDLFFHDYSLGPLFVHENYLNVKPNATKPNTGKHLELLWKSADSICMGDVVDKTIRSSSAWSLLPVQAVFSSVAPGEYMEGHLTSSINFPAWLGKNSRHRKFDRLLQELQSHMRLRITGNKESVGLEYLKHLCHSIVNPLATQGMDGIEEAVEVMKQYCLTREDLDSILEISVWPNQKDPMSHVESKVKAAFTRAYNKEAVLPYSTAIKKAISSSSKSQDYELEEELENEEDEETEDNDISSDAMIKARKRPASKKKDTSDEAGPSKSKKPRTKGKNK